MEYVARWIDLIRADTENQVVPDSSGNDVEGITNEQILAWLNEAQRDIQREIVQVNRSKFVTVETLSINSENYYVLPTYSILDDEVMKVEHSWGGQWFNMRKGSVEEQVETYELPHYVRDRRFFTFEDGKIRLNPRTGQGNLRVTYRKRVPDLELRKGTVLSITPNDGNPITAIELSTTGLDTTNLSTAEYLCTVTSRGVQTGVAIPVSSYNSSTREFAVENFDPTDWSISVGDYVCIGENVTTHCQLPRDCGDYLRAWAKVECLAHDNNFLEAEKHGNKRDGFRQTIISSFSNTGLLEIPISDMTVF